MTTLADKAILSGADNRPPMLEKDMYDSWKSIMELYMMNRQHGRMILEFVENGPLIWPSIEGNRVTRPKKYSELFVTEAIQDDCYIKATNIILQGLPPEVYALVSNHKVAKELWERIQLLMQGTSLTKHEREYVKLVRDLHTTNIDQLCAYLGKHEFHANEVRLMHERNSDLLALSQRYSNNQSSTPLSITYPTNDYQSSVSSSIPQLEYAPLVNQQPEFCQPDLGLLVPVFQRGNDPIDAINHVISFLNVVVTSRYPTTNNQLRGDKPLLLQGLLDYDELNTAKVALMANLSHYGLDALAEKSGQKSVNDTLASELKRYKEQVKVLKERQNVDLKSNDTVSNSNQSAQTVHMLTKPQFFYDHTTKQALGFQNPFYLKKAQQLEPKLYDGNVIKNTSAIVILDSEETLMLARVVQKCL
ncbi:hypothetical protein Tco_0747210 [Tanacetum coccineum]